jgi:hypothetical protein
VCISCLSTCRLTGKERSGTHDCGCSIKSFEPAELEYLVLQLISGSTNTNQYIIWTKWAQTFKYSLPQFTRSISIRIIQPHWLRAYIWQLPRPLFTPVTYLPIFFALTTIFGWNWPRKNWGHFWPHDLHLKKFQNFASKKKFWGHFFRLTPWPTFKLLSSYIDFSWKLAKK